MKKRVLSIVLACLMVLSVMPFTVAAAGSSVCQNEILNVDGEYKHTLETCEEGTFTKVEVVPSKCGEWGYTLYQCNLCGDYFADEFNKVDGSHSWEVTTPAKAATCTETGLTAVETCKDCGRTRGGNVTKKLGHDWVETERTGDCETAGVIKEECSRCDATRETPIGTTGNGHDWSDAPVEITLEPTWDDEGEAIYKCEVCLTTKKVVILPLKYDHTTHTLTKVEEVEATCTEAGNVEHWSCNVCGKLFLDDAATQPTTEAAVVVPALGHDRTGATVVTMPATCTEDGWDEYVCARCKVKVQDPIPATGHSYDYNNPYVIPAGCTSYGFKVYLCLTCGWSEKSAPINPTGHTTYDDVTSTDKNTVAPGCETNGFRSWKCGNCGVPQSQILDPIGHKEKTVSVDATCCVFAYEYTYCENGALCTHALVTEKAHTDGNTYDVTTDTNGAPVALISLTAGNTLNTDNHANATGTVNHATCTEDGNSVLYCPDCSQYFTKVEPAKGHNYAKTATTVKATCSAYGYTIYKCTVCHETKEDDIVPALTYQLEYTAEEAAAAHTGLTQNPLAADKTGVEVFRAGTCLIVGLYRYYCADCEKYVLVVIDGTGEGHKAPATFDATKNEFEAVEPTCTTDGKTAQYYCTVCNTFVESTVLTKLGHDWKKEAAKAPTCTEAGSKEKWTCKRCGAVDDQHKGETINATGHTYYNEVVGPTADYCQKSTVKCEKCDYVGATTTTTHTIQVTDYRSGYTCENYNYKHWECTNCYYIPVEYINGYQAITGHNYVVDPAQSYDATCMAPGLEVYVCSTCGDSYGQTIAQLAHKNAAGEEIKDWCQDTTADRMCVVLDPANPHEVGKSHINTITNHVAATCKDYGYDLVVCLDCGFNKATNVDDTYLADHTWGVWTTIEPATFKKAGKEMRICQVCGLDDYRDIDPKTGIEYTMVVENLDVPGAPITDGTNIKVTVYLESANTYVHNVKIDVTFPQEFYYDKTVFLHDELTANQVANKTYNSSAKKGAVTLVAAAPNAKDENGAENTTNVLIDEKQAFAEIYFQVNFGGEAKNFAKTVELSVAAEALKNDYTPVNDLCVPTSVKLDKYLDVNRDGDVDLEDALAATEIVTGEYGAAYDIVVDIDGDKEITLADVKALYEYIAGAKSYNDVR